MATNDKQSQVESTNTIIQAFFSENVGNDSKSKEKTRGKPFKMNYSTIRGLSYINPLIAICVQTLKHTITQIDGHFRKKEGHEDKNLDKEIEYLEALRFQPNPYSSNRDFWLKIFEDVLVIDRGAIEIVRNNKGWISELYPIDGATIKPNLDKYGNYGEIAYKQFVDNYSSKPVAEFEYDDVVLLMNNPITQLGTFGYSLSPIERIAQTIITAIHADNYNTGQFTKAQIPAFLATFPGASNEEISKLNAVFQNQEGKMFKGLVTNAQDFKMQLLKQSNSEIQFYELTQWLSKIIIASFGLSPQDLGLTMDINRATGEVQKAITKSQAISDLLALRKEFWDKIINMMIEKNPNFMYVEFANDEIDKIDELQQANIDKLYSEMLTIFRNAGIEIPENIKERANFGDLVEKEMEMKEEEKAPIIEEKEEEKKEPKKSYKKTEKRLKKEIANLVKWYK
jgi:phage portal protein BeeE